MNKGFELLASAIVTNAINEYKSKYKRFHRKKLKLAYSKACNEKDLEQVNSEMKRELYPIVHFFQSSWCEMLSGYTGEQIMDLIESNRKDWEEEVYESFLKCGYK